MTNRKARWAMTALAVSTLAFGISTAYAQPKPAAAPAPAAAAKPAPTAVILFLDRGTVLRKSAVGTDMYKQVEALAKKMEADFAPENKKIQADIQALQAQADVLTPQARQAKVKDLEARRQALQKKVQDRQTAIQGGLANARTTIERALAPILEKLLTERKANLLLDRGLVVLGATELDITNTVIDRLNKSLPKVVVTPAAPKAAAKPAAAKPAAAKPAG
jgi:outer membrane protein